MATSFNTLINESPVPVFVDFYADWCGPCKMLAPELTKLAQAMGDSLKVVKINVDKNQAAAAKYGIRGIPAMILFHKGEIVWRTTGYQTQQQLAQQLAPYLQVSA